MYVQYVWPLINIRIKLSYIIYSPNTFTLFNKLIDCGTHSGLPDLRFIHCNLPTHPFTAYTVHIIHNHILDNKYQTLKFKDIEPLSEYGSDTISNLHYAIQKSHEQLRVTHGNNDDLIEANQIYRALLDTIAEHNAINELCYHGTIYGGNPQTEELNKLCIDQFCMLKERKIRIFMQIYYKNMER